MIQISYISSLAHPMSTEEIVHFLQQCLTNNERDGITGMLLLGNETFLQTLEGEEKTIDTLYEKIMQDTRHGNVKLLSRKKITTRRYSDWSMGFKRVSDKELANVDGLIDFSERKFTPAYLAGRADDAQRLMDHFSSWDPLLRQIEEKEEIVKHLKTELTHARGSMEIAALVLESVASAGKIDDEHLRVCDVALSALRQALERQPQAPADVR